MLTAFKLDFSEGERRSETARCMWSHVYNDPNLEITSKASFVA